MVESQDSLYNMDSQNSIGSLGIGLIGDINSGDLLPILDSDMSELTQFSPNTIDDIIMVSNQQQHKYLTFHPEQQFSTIPAHFGQLPSTEQYDSNWGFDIELNSESASKTSWMFSTKLNKVFVKINTHLNVYAKYNVVDPSQPLFIRAMVVYQQTNDFAEPVRKCPNHRDQSGSVSANPEHILCCSVQGTEYLGTETGKLFENKLSLRIPMANVATGEPLKLQFTCQNSCSGGMNRRHTSVIFVLENEVFEILGRKVLNFKVCSCPKRDKDKDEEVISKSLPKKRKLEQQPTTSKKVAIAMPVIKQESDSTLSIASDIPMLPSDLQSVNSADLSELKREQQSCEVTITMPHQELKKQLLKNAYDLVAGEMTRTGDFGGLQRYLGDIQKQIDDN